jgi:pyrroloquinoline quinone (PQQ) biosynthesis protein C
MATAPTTSVSSMIRSRLGLMRPALDGVTERICGHSQLGVIYPELLRIEHGIVRASGPLLRTADGEAQRRATRGDAVAAGMITYLSAHADEEQHHDAWLLDDYATLGRDPDEVNAEPPSPTVAAMVGAIYYWVLHYHPVAVLGYMVVLEGFPPSVELIDEFAATTGYPAAAFDTLRHHSAFDTHHGDELWRLLDHLPLEPCHVAVAATAALHTMDLFITALDGLLGDFDTTD